MAYRRPAIEVTQEFQQSAVALALPSLPAVVVGPGYQIIDDANVGVYDDDNLSPVLYPYTGLAAGAVVNLTDTPETDSLAGSHKGVGVKISEAYLVSHPVLPATQLATGELIAPNIFRDQTLGAFAAIDPAATGAPNFYVEIISGAGVVANDVGRKFVISKTDDNNLVVGAEWESVVPITGVTYRIVEFRTEEVIPEADFAAKGITKAATGVTIDPALTSSTDTTAKLIVEGNVLLSWRAIRPDLAGVLNSFDSPDAIEAVFGVGSIVPANEGAYGVNLALQNTATAVNYLGLGADFQTSEEVSWQTALDFLESKDVYAISLLTHNTAVHQAGKTHVEQFSQPAQGRERIVLFNRTLVSTAILVPASGLGFVTTAGSGNGTSGTDNKTFRDPDNGSFITDGVNVGYFLEVESYTAVAGTDRSITPDEADYATTGPDELNLENGAFTASDVARLVLVKGATTAGNDQEYTIGTVSSTKRVVVTPAPAAAEVLPATARTLVASLVRNVANNAADNVVAATKTWTFANGAFTSADIGRFFFNSGMTDPGNNGLFQIASVTGGTVIVTVETPGADETFNAGGEDTNVYDLVREVSRNTASDSVDGTSRIFTFLGGSFTDDDVGRDLTVAGAQNAGNNATHAIEAVLAADRVRVSTATTPVTETFNGLLGSLTTVDVIANEPSTTQAAFITGTRHFIASINSEQQVTLQSDPTAGFGGTLSDVEYRVTRDLTRDEEATTIAGYSSSFASRRCVHTWPDVLAVSVNSVDTKVPGYFAGSVISGLVAGLPSQAGFTNLAIAGFTGRENSDDRFNATQLDTIAGGGTMVLVQLEGAVALTVRHQLTTDLSTIFFQELSVTKNVDLLARFFRQLYQRTIGTWNITITLLDMIKTRADGGFRFLLEQRVPRYGSPIRSGSIARLEESTVLPDNVDLDLDVTVPLPLNNLNIKLIV